MTAKRSIFLLVAGSGGGQFIVLLASPLLTRLYTPGDFGLLAVFLALMSTLLVIASFSYEVAIPLPGDEKDASSVMFASFGSLLFTTTGLLVTVVLWGPILAEWLEITNHGWLLYLVPVGIAAAGTFRVLSYWAVRSQEYPLLARTKFAQGVATASAQVGFGILGIGPAGLVAGDTVGRSIGIGVLFRKARSSLRDARSRFRFTDVINAGKRYKNYPLFVAPASIINAIGTQAPGIILIGMYGAEVAGWYALSSRVVGGPTALISTAVSQVFLERAARASRDSPEELRSLYVRALKRLFAIGAPLLLIVGVASPFVFGDIFGKEWQTAGTYTILLLAAYIPQFVAAPIAQMLNIIGREWVMFAWNVIRLILISCVFAVGITWSLTDVTVIGLYSSAMCLSYVIILTWTLIILRNHGVQAQWEVE